MDAAGLCSPSRTVVFGPSSEFYQVFEPVGRKCSPPVSKSQQTGVQIIHGLRSKGNMDFDEIGDVIPTVELAHDCGFSSLDMDQGYLPRVYKTHAWYPACPKTAGKYVYVARYVARKTCTEGDRVFFYSYADPSD